MSGPVVQYMRVRRPELPRDLDEWVLFTTEPKRGMKADRLDDSQTIDNSGLYRCLCTNVYTDAHRVCLKTSTHMPFCTYNDAHFDAHVCTSVYAHVQADVCTQECKMAHGS